MTGSPPPDRVTIISTKVNLSSGRYSDCGTVSILLKGRILEQVRKPTQARNQSRGEPRAVSIQRL